MPSASVARIQYCTDVPRGWPGIDADHSSGLAVGDIASEITFAPSSTVYSTVAPLTPPPAEEAVRIAVTT